MRRSPGDLRRRLLRHDLPLAALSAVVLALFMGLPPFDANRYAHVGIVSGAFPQQRERGREEAMDHAASASRTQPGTAHGQRSRPGGGHSSSSHGGGGGPRPQQQHGGGGSSVTPTSEEMQDRSFERRFSVATGYLALGLLVLTLLMGPVNLARRRRNPVSSYLRRDAGTWTAIFSVVHVIYSLELHGTGRISDFLDFFVADGRPLTNSFGWGNWTGLAALVVVAGLLALSSDAALRKLKAKRWKRLQRLNYALFALVIAHAVFYGAVLRTDSPYTLLLLLSVVAVFVGQATGISLHRRRYSRRTAEAA